jgi:predicted phage terminase large subunit-like protein
VNRLASLPLLDFIPALSPEFKAPYHLREWCEEFEAAARGEPVRSICACPIRHWKTQVTLHGVVWLLVKDPSARYIVLSHSFERATALGKRVRQLARAAGAGPAKGMDTIADWSTEQGGGVVIMSADQSRLGYDCHGLFFDDPVDEMGAMDPKKRDEVDETITHYTARCQRNGRPGPVMGIMSRWHPDDPAGRRLARSAVHWRYIAYPAIRDEGLPTERAFAEDVWPLESLKAMRAELQETDPTERIWWAQLMGEPRAAGTDLFGVPVRYSEVPKWSYRTVMGCDFAYSQEATADWFAACVLRLYGSKAYVMDFRRERLNPHAIEQVLKGFQTKYGRAPIFSYQSGPEIGLTNVLLERGVPIVRMQARYNKLVRAERTIKRVNDGNVVWPEDAVAPWARSTLQRIASFRGHEKDQDDEVDALVSACDGGWGGVGTVTRTGNGSRKAYPGFLG